MRVGMVISVVGSWPLPGRPSLPRNSAALRQVLGRPRRPSTRAIHIGAEKVPRPGEKNGGPRRGGLNSTSSAPFPPPAGRRTPLTSPGSVSHWLAPLKGAAPAAAQPLWERYYRRLVALARKKLRAARRRAADEEDVVQDAFHSFFRAVAQGR